MALKFEPMGVAKLPFTKLDGGRLIMAPPSIMDPGGLIHAVWICDKHPHLQTAISFNELYLLEGAIESTKFADKCEGCIHEKQYAASRFPNAGEPGGAEL